MLVLVLLVLVLVLMPLVLFVLTVNPIPQERPPLRPLVHLRVLRRQRLAAGAGGMQPRPGTYRSPPQPRLCWLYIPVAVPSTCSSCIRVPVLLTLRCIRSTASTPPRASWAGTTSCTRPRYRTWRRTRRYIRSIQQDDPSLLRWCVLVFLKSSRVLTLQCIASIAGQQSLRHGLRRSHHRGKYTQHICGSLLFIASVIPCG